MGLFLSIIVNFRSDFSFKNVSASQIFMNFKDFFQKGSQFTPPALTPFDIHYVWVFNALVYYSICPKHNIGPTGACKLKLLCNSDHVHLFTNIELSYFQVM
jgi:hypothetical protein